MFQGFYYIFKSFINIIDIDNLLLNDKLPILTGGTGLYINSLTCNMNFTDATNDENYRKELEELAIKHGDNYIHDMLKDIDPISYETFKKEKAE